MMEKFLHLTWEDVQLLTEEVATMIKSSGFKPDMIVAVSRGGFDPARILCDQLDVRRLACVQVESYAGMKRSSEPKVIIPVNADVSGKKVLVSDDVSDTGASLKKARDHILEMRAAEVKVVTLHIKPWSTFLPDFFASSTDAWVVYPWEIRECLTELASKFHNEGLKDSVIREKLIELGFKSEVVYKILSIKHI